MNSSLWARREFGFTQPQLAIYLSVSLSVLKLAETNRRSLPTAALLKLANLQLLHAALKEKLGEKDDLISIVQPSNKKIKNECAIFTQQLAKLKKQLSVARMAYAQATNLLSLAEKLLAHLPEGDEGKKDALWLEVQILEAREALKKSGLDAQTYLQWKIDCHEFGITRAKELFEW